MSSATQNMFGKGILLVFCSIFLVFFGAAESPELELVEGEEEMWLNLDQDLIEVQWDYCSNENTEAYIEATNDGSTVSGDERIEISLGEDDTGVWEIDASCDTNSSSYTEKKHIAVINIEPEIVDPTGQQAYRNERLGIDGDRGFTPPPVTMRLVFDGFEAVDDHDEFDFDLLRDYSISDDFEVNAVSLSGSSMDLSRNFHIDEVDGEEMFIEFNPRIPINADPSYQSIEVDMDMDPVPGRYEDTTDATFRIYEQESSAVYISPMVIENVEPSQTIVTEELEDIAVEFTLEDYAPSVTSDDFQLRIDGDSDNYFSLREDNGEYRLEVRRIPDLPGEDTISLFVEFQDDDYGTYEVFEFEVERKVAFDGRVTDSFNDPAYTEFIAIDESDRGQVRFSTDRNGYYSEQLEESDEGYEFNIDFRPGGEPDSPVRGSLLLNKVDLGPQYDGTVDFEYFESGADIQQQVDIEGVEATNMMAATFGYPIEGDSEAVIHYDTGALEDPTASSVRMFECQNWNFRSQQCVGEWRSISDISVDPTSGKIRFPVTPLETEFLDTSSEILMSAYAVGTQAQLELDSSIQIDGVSDSEIAVGEEMEFTGVIVSSEGGTVQNADVELALENDEGEEVVEGEDNTNSDGEFSIDLEAPEKGEYSLNVRADRSPFESMDIDGEETLETYVKEGIELTSDLSIPDIVVGEETELTFTLENTGQTDIEDITLDASGLDYLNLEDTEIELLEEGDLTTVTLVMALPEDYFEGSHDEQPEIILSAKGQGQEMEVEAEESLQTIATAPEEGNTTQESVEEENEDDNRFLSASEFADSTGEFIAAQSSVNMALGLILLFMMILAGAMKKNKDQDDRELRRNIVNPNSNGGGISSTGSRPDISSKTVKPVKKPRNLEQEQDEQDTTQSDEKTEDELDDEKDLEKEEVEDHEEVSKMADAMEKDGQEEDESEEEVSGQEDVKCDVCGDSFDTEAGLEIHKKTAH